MLIGMCILSVLCCVLEKDFLGLRRAGRDRAALIFKGLASLCFVTVGCLAAALRGQGWITAAGLGMGLCGDLLLGLRKQLPKHHDAFFVAGAAAFSLGHGFYLASLRQSFGAGLLPALGIAAVLTAGSELYARRAGFAQGKMHLPGLAYIGVEAWMCGMALLGLWMVPGIASGLFTLGGLSFFVSDNLLCAYSFGNRKTEAVDNLLHGTYLAAQLLIGWSILFL